MMISELLIFRILFLLVTADQILPVKSSGVRKESIGRLIGDLFYKLCNHIVAVDPVI